MLDDSDFDIPEDDSPEPPSGNRRFLTIVGILGTIMVLALIAMAVYVLVILPQQEAAPTEEGPSAVQLTGTAEAKALQVTATNTSVPATATNTPTNTSEPATATPTETPVTPIFTSAAGPATQTVEALLTQAAVAQTEAASTILTFTPTATTGDLPDAGFADNVGLPGLLIVAGVLLLVIVAARRLRTA